MTGFRLNTKRINQRLSKFGTAIRADAFRPDVAKFAQAALSDAVKATPVRSVGTIRRNQRGQFYQRERYIRSHPGSAHRQISRDEFIEGRAQARFLFRKSWKQCADSVGLRVNVSPAVAAAHTRRWNGVIPPPRGYAQWRGGDKTLSVVIFNPFLSKTSGGGHTALSTSKYKPFSAAAILAIASARHRPAFLRSVNNRIRREIYAARKL